MRHKLFFAAATLAGLASTTALSAMPLVGVGQQGTQASPSVPDTSDYVTATLMGDKFEVAAAKVAQGKSSNYEVQRFAQMMISDHSASSEALSTLLKQNTFAFAAPAKLDNEHAALVRQLWDSPKTDFSRRYMEQQVAMQESALRLQNTYAQGGRDDSLKKFASTTSPKLKMQLELARRILSKMMRVASRLQ